MSLYQCVLMMQFMIFQVREGERSEVKGREEKRREKKRKEEKRREGRENRMHEWIIK